MKTHVVMRTPIHRYVHTNAGKWEEKRQKKSAKNAGGCQGSRSRLILPTQPPA